MSIIKLTFAVPSKPRRNEMPIRLCVLILSLFCFCCANPANAQHKAVAESKKSEKQADSESDILPHLTSWRQVSLKADKLIDEKKFEEAENLLISILPRAKSEAPQKVDYALTLCRLSTALYNLKKYPQALARVQEAINILSQKPSSERQHKVMWRSMLTKSAILLAMKNNIEAEASARKLIAYSIAFPDVATSKQVKIAYSLLNNSLEAQKKFGESKKISDIMNRL